MKNKNYLTFIAIIIAGLIIGGAILISGESPNNETPPQEEQEEMVEEEPETEEVSMDDINLDDYPSLGDSDAPIVMVEYSDFACPYCSRFFDETLPKIKENYIDTGEVLFIYKDLTVVGGDKAAEAAHCAGEQDAYWEYNDLLFENSNADRRNWNNSEIHADYADQLGLDQEALITCFEDGQYAEKVQNSTQEAVNLGITGTPGFVINGEIVKGAQPYQVFEEVIERKLNE
jgi:protein-disulfide isomerase